MYRYCGSQTGNIVNYIPGSNNDGLATKDNNAKNAKVLIGNTGNVTVNLSGLNTTSVVESGKVRAVVQRVPYNNGAAVAGPETISDTTLSVSNNAASVTLPYTNAKDGYTITLLPPSDTTVSTVAVSENSGQCLDDTNLSTFTLIPVSALGNSKDYQLAAVHSGKCVEVSNVSTTAGALIHQWTCDPASALATKKNQVWRLVGND
ncbi:RICIN domain-containing protein [Streptomyces sp. NPDC052101]|uniref:RICIN domain-containing protein n=1 Tax=Streptomyces sp. NPDC052101 TaxID=3155763 RepID=UPI003437A2EC